MVGEEKTGDVNLANMSNQIVAERIFVGFCEVKRIAFLESRLDESG